MFATWNHYISKLSSDWGLHLYVVHSDLSLLFIFCLAPPMWVVLVAPLGSYRGGKSEQFSGSSGAELAYWSSRHGKQQNLCHSLALTLAKNQGNGWYRLTGLNRSGRYRNWSSTVLRTFTTLYKRFPKVGQVLGLFNLALQNIHQGPRQILSLHSST